MLVYSGKILTFESPEDFHPEAKINTLIRLENNLVVGFKRYPGIDLSRGMNILFVGNPAITTKKIKYILCWSSPISIVSPIEINEIEISGAVGALPEEKMFPDGGTVHSFPMRVKNGRSTVVWLQCSLFNKANIAQYIEKGKLLTLRGYIKPKTANGKTYINIIGNSVDFLTSQSSAQSSEQNSEQNSEPF